MSVQPLRPQDPRELGDFRLAGFIASGGGGSVYLGFRPGSARAAAVKLIKPSPHDPQWRSRLAHEIDAIRRVGGEFTATFVDADTSADPPWLATRYVASPSLHTLVAEQGKLSERGGWWLLASVAEALLHIHSEGLLHRDLKPANVLVARDGIKVIDFGLSRSTGEPTITQQGMWAGTRYYASPEQAVELHSATNASDVYGLAATTVFAVSGHAPYDPSSQKEWLLGSKPNLDGVPGDMSGLLGRCLSADPVARPTVSELMDLTIPRVLNDGVTVFLDVVPPLDSKYLAAIMQHEEEQRAAAQQAAASMGTPPDAPDDLVPTSGSVTPSNPGGGSLGGHWAEQWNNALDRHWDRYDG